MDNPEISEKERERRRKISETSMGRSPEREAERRHKISESKKGKPRPDLAERNRSEAMRSIPRFMSEEARKRMAEERTTHGQSRSRMTGRVGTPTYYIWAAMVQRCTNPRNKDWHLYGGRGITVCERWLDFTNFYADMGDRPEGLSIDRIDNDGNYEPGNCRWATALVQIHNRRGHRSPDPGDEITDGPVDDLV